MLSHHCNCSLCGRFYIPNYLFRGLVLLEIEINTTKKVQNKALKLIAFHNKILHFSLLLACVIDKTMTSWLRISIWISWNALQFNCMSTNQDYFYELILKARPEFFWMCAAHDLRPASLFGKFSISGFLRNVTQSEEISNIERWLVLKITL